MSPMICVTGRPFARWGTSETPVCHVLHGVARDHAERGTLSRLKAREPALGYLQALAGFVSLPTFVRIQLDLAQADCVGGDFDTLVLGNKLERLFQRQAAGGR